MRNSPTLSQSLFSVNKDGGLYLTPSVLKQTTPSEKLHYQPSEEEYFSKGLEDGNIVRYYQKLLSTLESASAILCILGLMTGMMGYEMEYLEWGHTSVIYMLSLGTFSTIFLIVVRVLRAYLKLALKKARNIVTLKDNLITSNSLNYLVLDIALLLPHPNVLFYGKKLVSFSYHLNIEVEYSYNDILTILMCLRLYMIFKIFLNFTIFLSPRAYRVCKIYGCECGYKFAMKCIMKELPNRALFTFLVMSICVFAYILRICERPLQGGHFAYLENSIWMIIQTLFTIGYGENAISSNIGRFFMALVGLWGTFITSMMVVSLTNTLLMSNAENKALNILVRLNNRKDLRSLAGRIVVNFMKLKHNRKSGSYEYSKQLRDVRKIKTLLKRFSFIKRDVESTYDPSSVFELMERNFEGLREEFNVLSKNEELILEKMNIKQYTMMDRLREQVKTRRDALMKVASSKKILKTSHDSLAVNNKLRNQKSEFNEKSSNEVIEENRSMESSKLMLPKGAIEYNY